MSDVDFHMHSKYSDEGKPSIDIGDTGYKGVEQEIV